MFFVDDNFAINVKRTKSLLRDIIAAGAQLNWVAQISANLLRDEELVDLIAESGGKWIFIGMESLDPANLASVNKSFNKPGEYAAGAGAAGAAERLRHHVVHLRAGQRHGGRGRAHAGADPRLAAGAAGLRADHAVSGDSAIRPAGEGRAADAAEALAGICAVPDGAHAAEDDDLRRCRTKCSTAWTNSYSPRPRRRRIDSIADEPVPYKISHLVARIFFRGIYFPPKGAWGWFKVIAQNRGSIYRIVRESFTKWHGTPAPLPELDVSDAGD